MHTDKVGSGEEERSDAPAWRAEEGHGMLGGRLYQRPERLTCPTNFEHQSVPSAFVHQLTSQLQLLVHLPLRSFKRQHIVMLLGHIGVVVSDAGDDAFQLLR